MDGGCRRVAATTFINIGAARARDIWVSYYANCSLMLIVYYFRITQCKGSRTQFRAHPLTGLSFLLLSTYRFPVHTQHIHRTRSQFRISPALNPDWDPVTLIAVSDSNLEGVVGKRGVSHVTTSFVFLRVSSLRFRVLLQV